LEGLSGEVQMRGADGSVLAYSRSKSGWLAAAPALERTHRGANQKTNRNEPLKY
jgi:hypothetical protein